MKVSFQPLQFVCFLGGCDNFCVEFEIYAQYIYNYDIYKQKRTRFLDSTVGFFVCSLPPSILMIYTGNA